MQLETSDARTPCWRGWLPLLVLPAAVVLLTPSRWPRWALLALLAAAVYGACKWLTWRRRPPDSAPAWKRVAYLVAWPGLDAPAFLADRPPPLTDRPSPGEWLFAAGKTLAGAAILWGLLPRLDLGRPLVLGLAGMGSLILVLHCGLFHVASCFWRSRGVAARPLMNRPLAASSLSDFWGRRWNTAFRDLTHRHVFRPVANRAGRSWGIAASFIFSGIIHDLAISVPAAGGYGLPTLYFLVQGAALGFERTRTASALGLDRGWRARAYTMAIVAAPAGILFHPPYLERVIVPFLRAIGAGP